MAVVAVVIACRKAPGPADCLRLADAVFRASNVDAEGRRSGDPGRPPRASVSERDQPPGRVASFDRAAFVRQCLTTPFDRELVECAVHADARGQNLCWAAYEARYERTHAEGR